MYRDERLINYELPKLLLWGSRKDSIPEFSLCLTSGLIFSHYRHLFLYSK